MFCVCMENLRSLFRTICEQIFFPCAISAIFLPVLTRYFIIIIGSRHHHPNGPTPSMQCLYVIFLIARYSLTFSRRYTYRFLNSLLLQPRLFRHTLYIAVIMSVSINTVHIPNTYPWQIMKNPYLIVGPSE
jgi:hypothetical protein